MHIHGTVGKLSFKTWNFHVFRTFFSFLALDSYKYNDTENDRNGKLIVRDNTATLQSHQLFEVTTVLCQWSRWRSSPVKISFWIL